MNISLNFLRGHVGLTTSCCQHGGFSLVKMVGARKTNKAVTGCTGVTSVESSNVRLALSARGVGGGSFD